MIAQLDILNAFASKVISDCIDISVNTIRNADKERRSHSRNLQTRMYQVIIDTLNEYTGNRYEGTDRLYEAAESIIKGFGNESGNHKETVKSGLTMIASQVTGNDCENFLGTLRHVICRDENRDLRDEIVLIRQEQIMGGMHEGFERNNQNFEKTHNRLDCAIEGIEYIKDNLNSQMDDRTEGKVPVENRAVEYAGKWDKNVFLNDFNERDENAGVNVKLRDLYLEEQLPHYLWKRNKKPQNDLKNLLWEYVGDNNDKKMLLILGQPGIGKSTLITWVTANFKQKRDEIFVYQFASDLKEVNWQGDKVFHEILKAVCLEFHELEGKILILDGFDETCVSSDRERILNKLNQEIKGMFSIEKFSLIITCRENYLYEMDIVEYDYISLQAWDDKQIKNFCRIYWRVTADEISESKINRVLESRELLGIPLILYMVLALDIALDGSRSILDIYDQIFSPDRGSIYDRCVGTARYGEEHKISATKIKQQIHKVSQRIAFWIFENNAEGAFISRAKYEEICDSAAEETSEGNEDLKRDFLSGNYFKIIRHCEGVGTDELHFVHRTMYEYFTAVYFAESVGKLKSKEEAAGKLGMLLKDGRLTRQILEFIRFKIDSMEECHLSDIIKDVFRIMLRDGMAYHIGVPLLNILDRERNIFSNMLKVVGAWNESLGSFDDKIITYLQCSKGNILNLKGIILGVDSLYVIDLSFVDLAGANLSKAYLSGIDFVSSNLVGADLSGANLSGAYLNEARLFGANLRKANLVKADLAGADLRGARLEGADLGEAILRRARLGDVFFDGANLQKTEFDEKQVELLDKKYDLSKSRVFLFKTKETVSYEEYCARKREEV